MLRLGSWLVSSVELFLGKDGANQQSLPSVVLSQRNCEQVSGSGWSIRSVYFRKEEQSQSMWILCSITSPHSLWRSSANSFLLLMFTHCHWSRRVMKADGSWKPPVFMAVPSKNGLKIMRWKIWKPVELLKYHLRVYGWSQVWSFWAFPCPDPSC